ncbi:MAG TPA: cytochrome c oxidase assembly protein, partial [Arthrobacter bacterium]|nr:cytochrome c oxidase assembly protein [Arthrobacter sp.]
MPPLEVVVGAWQIDWAALVLIVASGMLYGLGVRT